MQAKLDKELKSDTDKSYFNLAARERKEMSGQRGGEVHKVQLQSSFLIIEWKSKRQAAGETWKAKNWSRKEIVEKKDARVY